MAIKLEGNGDGLRSTVLRTLIGRCLWGFLFSVLLSCYWVGSSLCAQEPSIGINFVGRYSAFGELEPSLTAGAEPQQNWTNAPGHTSRADGTLSQLSDSEFEVTGAQFSWMATGASSGLAFVTRDSAPNARLLSGFQKGNPSPDLTPVDQTERLLFTFSNLDAAGTYDVIVYFVHDGGAPLADATIGAVTYYIGTRELVDGSLHEGTSVDPDNRSMDVNLARWNNVTANAGVGGEIIIEVRKFIEIPQLSNGVGVAGIQLIKVTGDWTPPTPPEILAQPEDRLAGDGGTVRFDIQVNGDWPIEWLMNDDVIQAAAPGASTLRFPAQLADDQARIKAIVNGTLHSAEAVLTVNPSSPQTIVPGWIAVRRYNEITDWDVYDMLLDSNYPEYPSTVELWPHGTSFDIAAGTLYGMMADFVFRVPVSEDYDFFLSSDDGSAFWLNEVGSAGLPTAPDELTETPLIFRADVDHFDGFEESFREVPARGGVVTGPGDRRYPTTAIPVALDQDVWYAGKFAFKEHGGRDFGRLGMRATSNPEGVGVSANSPLIIGREAVGFVADPADNTTVVLSSPVDTTSQEYAPTTFHASVETSPFPGAWNAQWQIDRGSGFEDIPGAYGQSYTDPGQPVGNFRIRAMIVSLGGTMFTGEASWTVTPRTPQILNHPLDALAVVGDTVLFEVETDSSRWPVVWLVNGVEEDPSQRGPQFRFQTDGSDKGAVVVARVGGSTQVDSESASLTLDDPAPEVLMRGFARVRRYLDIPSGRVSRPEGAGGFFFDHPKFQERAFDEEFFISGLVVPQTQPNLIWFGSVIDAYVEFPETGDYHWFIRSDDSSELFVNPTGGTPGILPNFPSVDPDWPAAYVPDAAERDCCDAFSEPAIGDAATSAPLRFEAEELYGVTVVLKENFGGDWFQAAIRSVDDPTPASALAPIVPGWVRSWISPAGHRGVIRRHPKDRTVREGGSVRLGVEVEVTPPTDPYGIQWQREVDGQFVDLPGGNELTYEVSGLSLNETSRFRAVAYTLAGEIASDPATVTVLPDRKRRHAWEITDESPSDAGLVFSQALSPEQLSDAVAHGWQLEMTSRLVTDFGSSSTMMLGFGTGSRVFEVALDLDPAGNLLAEVTNEDGSVESQIVANFPQGDSQFHHHEIRFDPVGNLATYLFDGRIVKTWPGALSTDWNGEVVWGAQSAPGQGQMTVRRVRFHLLCEGVIVAYSPGHRGTSLATASPADQGWVKEPAESSPGVFDAPDTRAGSETHSRARNAWFIHDVSRQPGSVFWLEHLLSEPEAVAARQSGWQLRARCRLADDHEGESSQAVRFDDGQSEWGVTLDWRADGALVADLGGLSGAPFVLTTNRGEARAYHTHEIVFAPEKASEQFIYLFDGRKIHGWDAGMQPAAEGGGRVAWGAMSDSGQGALLVRSVELWANGLGQLARFDGGLEGDPTPMRDPYFQGWMRRGDATEIREGPVLADAVDGSWDCRGAFDFGRRNDRVLDPLSSTMDGQGRLWVGTESDGIKVYDSEGSFLFSLDRFGSEDRNRTQIEDLEFAPDGNLWVADTRNGEVILLDAEGIFVGSYGNTSFQSERLATPSGIAFNSLGQAVIVDRGYGRVQVRSSDGGFVRTFGSHGDGPGELRSPYAVVVDSQDQVYVADSSNERIQVFDPEGSFVRSFGTLGSSDGEFGSFSPRGLAFNSQEQLVTLDEANNRIQIFEKDGTFVSSCCSGGFAFGQANDISIYPDGRIGLTLGGVDRVSVLDSSFSLIRTVGDSAQDFGQFVRATALDLSAENDLFVLNSERGSVDVFDSKGMFLRAYDDIGFGSGTSYPRDLAMAPNGDVVISFGSASKISVLDSDGSVLTVFGERGLEPHEISDPNGVAVFGDGEQYEIYVSDRTQHSIMVFDPAGNYLRSFGSEGSEPGELSYPADLEFDRNGHLLVADRSNRRIQVFSREGQYLRSLADGTGPGQFSVSIPQGLFADSEGRIYVTSPYHGFFILDEGGNLLASFFTEEQNLGGILGLNDILVDRRGHLLLAGPSDSRIGKIVNCLCPDGSSDVDCNGVINVLDLVSARDEINHRQFDTRRRLLGDADQDGNVDASDVDMLIGRIFTP